MIELIPKVSLTDSKTWVEPANIVCISSKELPRAPHYLVEKSYFQNKEVLVSAVIPDESETSYLELLEHLPARKNIVLTTNDCATYVDALPEEREQEIFWMLEENHDLFEQYKNQYPIIGILKGVTSEEHQWVYAELKDYCHEFLLYLSGYIKSNPRWFNLQKHLSEILPDGFNSPLWCYGFNEGSIKGLPIIQQKYNIQNAIIESYRARAVYKENPHFTRKVRMQKAWTKKLKLFNEE